jgi:nucleoside 2-deoxyribosyltransferase
MSVMSSKQAKAFIAGIMADAMRPGAPPRIVPTANNSLAKRKVYLADNSRLRPDADRQRDRAEAICERYSLAAEWPSEHFLLPVGLTAADRAGVGLPLDGDKEPGGTLRKAWRWIGKCDALVAEVTPFRGEHLNPVIAFEIGVAVVLEIPVFAWTSSVYPIANAPGRSRPRLLDERVWCGDEVAPDGFWRDDQGNLVENFGMVECAAIAGNFMSISTSRSDAIRSCAEYLKKRGGWGDAPAAA